MSDIKEPLIRDLVAWCARHQRSYAEVLDAWRTSCPRLTVWEDAIERGLLETRPGGAGTGGGSVGLMVAVTDKGRDLLGRASVEIVRPPIGPVVAVPRPAA